MELFNPKKLNFDFVSAFKITGYFSLALTLLSVIAFFVPGLNYGIDFKGGLESRVIFEDKNISAEQIRKALNPEVKNLAVVSFSDQGKNEFVITGLPEKDQNVASIVSEALTKNFGPKDQTWTLVSQSFVGPRVGKELRKSALLALIYTTLLIAIYMYWRFDSRFSPGAIACVIHDLILTTGFLILTQTEFSVTIVAALLTLAGYSINDTVVVFDRIRESETKFIGRDLKSIINYSINSTLSRTLITAGTTLIACLVLLFVGAGEIPNFAKTLVFGIVVGTYSSIFVASPLFMWASQKFSGIDNYEGKEAHAGANTKK